MTINILKNCTIFDGSNEELIENGSIVIENDLIREVTTGDVSLSDAGVIDMGGRFVMPGLLDLHFHAYSITFNMHKLDTMTMPMKVAHAARLLKGTLHRGYTTVRDPAGGEIGLQLAINQGLMEGPRFYHGGKALSQTGGHGDMRPSDAADDICGCAANSTFSEVVDGVDEVRKFCRNELRKVQNREFEFRADIVKPIDQLRSATSINAEIMKKDGMVGCIAPGAFADIIAIDKNPLEDIHVMTKPDENFSMIMKGGEFVRALL
ncbi:amidohydrolase family protein [Pseudomaricurvus alkylphenolicus]|uniref:amidohydrolase family protein n=1 Tax=Pseudomaricurvus alkylphenolicus TaxID=1306991 RepID=UPI001420096A|nr:amidohydrolase family protein [Pseudomaricurvus alkylphenolicus]NIB45077.1 amidohydrolase family protein [Pseudomaricurvus alkylphenolicus]